ncbi:MAG: Verru_Chthon cassette protein D [Chthoniobacteraceae bacterium]
MKACWAFSLVELLVVVALTSVLMTLAAPMLNSVVGANNVTQGGQSLAEQIDAVRQLAEVRGQTAELRFLKKNGDTHYSGMQLFLVASGTANTTGTAAGKAVAMPKTVAILDNSTLSPWFETMTVTGTMPAGGTWGSASYKAFRVRSSGAVELASGTNRTKLYLSISSDRTPSTASSVANFVTIQVNPDTARPLVYRP